MKAKHSIGHRIVVVIRQNVYDFVDMNIQTTKFDCIAEINDYYWHTHKQTHKYLHEHT